jgi:hypothetical protein
MMKYEVNAPVVISQNIYLIVAFGVVNRHRLSCRRENVRANDGRWISDWLVGMSMVGTVGIIINARTTNFVYKYIAVR